MQRPQKIKTKNKRVHMWYNENGKGCRANKSAPFCHIFLNVISFPACLCAVFVLFFSGYSLAEPEVRGLWVVRDNITSHEQIKQIVDFAETHHYNVLFVQVRGRGDAFYRSYFVPGPANYPNIPEEFDPLSDVIRQAHAKGIEVHAWFNMYYTWSAETTPVNPEHPLLKHPEWFMVSIDGDSMAEGPINEIQNNSAEGRYLSPVLESVKRYLSRVITEVMVTYNIDGVHLDYIRYPGRNYDFHPIVRQQFSECYGVDPIQVVEGDTDIDPTLMYLGKWVEFKTEMIDKQVRSIRRRIDLVDRKIRLSAAVKPHADEAYYHYGQNWAGWLNEGIVDFVVTMSYFEEVEEFFDVMSASLNKVDGRKVIGGIGAYKLIPEVAAEQISLIRRWGLMGFCFFSYTVFLENPQFIEILEESITVNDEGLPSDFRPYIRKYYE